MVDYLNELRETCLEAYTGIVQGLKGDQENVHRKSFLISLSTTNMNLCMRFNFCQILLFLIIMGNCQCKPSNLPCFKIGAITLENKVVLFIASCMRFQGILVESNLNGIFYSPAQVTRWPLFAAIFFKK